MSNRQDFKKAKLFVCASCKWIFHKDEIAQDGIYEDGCPKCGFGYYTAHWVYGNKAYKLAITQEEWLNQKLLNYEMKLQKEIKETNAFKENEDKKWWKRQKKLLSLSKGIDYDY